MDLPTYHMAYANFVSTKQQNHRTSSSISSETSSSPSSHRSSSSNNSASKSQKLDFYPVRSRVEFTKDQLKHLDAEYKKDAYLFKDRRLKIADDLGLTDKNVAIWFQNRRRKDKKEMNANGNKVARPLTQNPQMQRFFKYLKASTKNGQSSSKNVVLRKVADISQQKQQNTLPVLKPLAAQFVKSTGRTVPKEFNPQLIVQVPLPSNQAPQKNLHVQQLTTEAPEVLEEQPQNGLTPEEELQQFLHFKPKSILYQKPHQLPPAQPQHVTTTQIMQVLPKQIAELLKLQSEQLQQSQQLVKEQARQLEELKRLQIQHSTSATLKSVAPQQQVIQTGYQQTPPPPVQQVPNVKPEQSDKQPENLQQVHLAPKLGKQLQKKHNNITQLQTENKKPLVQSSQQVCPHEIHLQNQQHAHNQQYCGKTDLNLVKAIPISDEAICDGVISLIKNTNSTTSETYHKELQGIVSNFVDVLEEPTTNKMVSTTDVDMLSKEEISTFLDKFLDETASNKDTNLEIFNSCENSPDFDFDNFKLDYFAENPTVQQQDSFMDLSIDSNISFGFLEQEDEMNKKGNPRPDDLIDILDICRETGIDIHPTPCEESFLMEVLACANAPSSSDSVSKMASNELVSIDYQDQTIHNMYTPSVPALATPPDTQIPVINISFEDYFKSADNCTQPVITVTL